MRLFKKNEKSSNISIKIKISKYLKKIRTNFNKKVLKNKNKFTMKESLTFMLITFALGMIIGGVIMYGKGSFNGHISASMDDFISTYQDILNNYYQDIDADELLESGLSGMIDYLGDPYADYMTIEETNKFNETVEGEYCGIGAEIVYDQVNNIIKFGEIFADSPASISGLLEGDILLAVNDQDVTGMGVSAIAQTVKGERGTKVTIKVLRGEEELTFEVTRDNVDIQSVESEVYEQNGKKIGYLYLSVFASNTDEQFEEGLLALEKQKIDALIIDVRGNSGGYLTTVTNIISMFMEKGSSIYQLKTKGEIEVVKDKTKEKRTYPVAVLADSSSASASELLSAVFKENYNAPIIGTTTYGKGRVQKAYTLSNGSLVKYTFQEWLTPLGNSIDLVGVEPTIKLEYVYEADEEIDNQLREALKVLTQE